MTGAPTKKIKFPNTIQAGPGGGAGLPGMFAFSFLLFGLAMSSPKFFRKRSKKRRNVDLIDDTSTTVLGNNI